MSRLFREGMTLAYAHEQAKVLPAGVILSGRLEHGEWILDIALESTLHALGVRIGTLGGRLLAAGSLARRDAEIGEFHYGELFLDEATRFLRVDLTDRKQLRIERYSFAVDSQLGLTFPCPEFRRARPGAKPEKPVRYGHLPSDGGTGQLILHEIRTDDKAIHVFLGLDSDSPISSLQCTCFMARRQDGRSEDNPRTESVGLNLEISDAPISTEISLNLPLGTFRVLITPLGRMGNQIDELRCVLDLISLDLYRPSSDLDELHVRDQLATAFPGTDPGADLESMSSETRTLDRTNLLEEFESFVSTREEDYVPGDWPRRVGGRGVEVGPPGYNGERRVLSLEAVKIEGESRILTLILNDGGRVAQVAIAQAGRIEAVHRIDRVAGSEFARLELKFPLPIRKTMVFLLDRRGYSIPNASTGLNLESGEFEVVMLPPNIWFPTIRFCEDVVFGRTACGLCHRSLDRKQLVPFRVLDERSRLEIQRRCPPGQNLLGICPPCSESLERVTSGGLANAGLLSGYVLSRQVARLGQSILGSLLPCTWIGAQAQAWLGPARHGFFTPEVSTLVVSITGASVIAAVSYRLAVAPLVDLVKLAMRSGRRMPSYSQLVPAFVILAFAWLCGSRRFLNPAIQSTFFHQVWPLAAIVGMFLGPAVARLLVDPGGLSGMGESADEAASRLVGAIYREACRSNGAVDLNDFEFHLRTFVGRGLLALEFRIYRYEFSRQQFVRLFHQGPAEDLEPASFGKDEDCMLARVAAKGSALIPDQSATPSGRESDLILPISGIKNVDYIVDIVSLSPAYDPAILEPVLDGLRRVLEASLVSVQTRLTATITPIESESPVKSEALQAEFGRIFTGEELRALEDDPSPLGLDGETVAVTVMWLEFLNFQTATSTWGASRVIRAARTFLERFTPVMVKHGGFVERMHEASMVIVFGRPRSLPDYALGAARAACEVSLVLPEILRQHRISFRGDVRLRMGLASGEAAVGNVGTPERIRYAIVSPAVDRARLVATIADQYGVNLIACPRTLQMIRGRAATRVLDRVTIEDGGEVFDLSQIIGHEKKSIVRLSPAALERYAAGFEAYLAGDFELAMQRFESVLDEDPSDGPSRILERRCRELLADSSFFDGVFHLRV